MAVETAMFSLEIQTESHTVKTTVIDPAISEKRFACDLNKCKGACCTMPGDIGAPLLDPELEEIEKAFPVVVSYLSESHLSAIDRYGLYVGKPGSYTTPVVDRRACAFVTFEGGIAKCAFEKAYWNNEISWRKPLSCHLFPIRVDRGRIDRLRFEHLHECHPAIERGERENTYLSEFVKPALVRAYGTEWYNKFLDLCRARLQGALSKVGELE